MVAFTVVYHSDLRDLVPIRMRQHIKIIHVPDQQFRKAATNLFETENLEVTVRVMFLPLSSSYVIVVVEVVVTVTVVSFFFFFFFM